MIRKNIVLILALSLCITSCQKREDQASQQQDAQDKAMTLIEQGHNDEAISLMNSDLVNNPTSDRDREILASAYANRAGIRVEDFYGFALTYDGFIKGPQDFSTQKTDLKNMDLAQIFPSLPPEAKGALQQLIPNLVIIQTIRLRVQQIPLISDDQSKDLLLAIDTLASTKSPGAHVYRAILEIIILRAAVEHDSKLISDAFAAKSSIHLCQNEFDFATQYFEFSFDIIGKLLADLAIAFPSHTDDLTKTQNQLSSVMQSLPTEAQSVRSQLCQGS